MSRTLLRLGLLVVVVTGLSLGTSGFTAVQADRTVSVNVVDNDAAYVGVVACEKAAENGNGNDNGNAPIRVWVTNRYTDSLDVLEIASADAARTNQVQNGGAVAAGERERFEPVFDAPVDTVTVRVTADGFDATVTRDVSTKSACPYATATNTPNGNATTPTHNTTTSEAGAE